MFSIGEFSKITGLTVKTLRSYHKQGNCRPASLGKVAEGYPRRDAGREGFHMSHEGVARILKGRRAA